MAITVDKISDDMLDEIEQAVGMGHGAWDTINPREIIAAVLNAREHSRSRAMAALGEGIAAIDALEEAAEKFRNTADGASDKEEWQAVLACEDRLRNAESAARRILEEGGGE